jgi:hypothetical protein
MEGSTRSSEGVDFLGRFMVLSVHYLSIGNLKPATHQSETHPSCESGSSVGNGKALWIPAFAGMT